MELLISEKDKLHLREVAKEQLYYSNMEMNQLRKKEWYLHNSLLGNRPMVHLELWTFAQEILPPLLQCEGDFAKDVEIKLYQNFLNQKLFDDDRVTPDYYSLELDTSFSLFSLTVQKEHLKTKDGIDSLGHHFIPLLKDLEEDYSLIKTSSFSADLTLTQRKKNLIEEAIGDILPVKIETGCLYSVPTQMLVHLMSMQDMMLNMYDYPELFLQLMEQIANDTLLYYKYLEEQRLIFPTNSSTHLGQGSFCYSTELPDEQEWKNRPFTPKDVWGFMDSQETVGISSSMFKTYIFPTYEKISSQFGLLSYGCCEPIDPIWESCISKLKNLRKVSISPWCKEEYMGEQLRGSNIIYHRKPSPNFLGLDKNLDEAAVRKHIAHSLLCAKGCKMEITQRDVYTIHHNILKAKRYVEIIREEIEKTW